MDIFGRCENADPQDIEDWSRHMDDRHRAKYEHIRNVLSTHRDILRDLLDDEECGPVVRQYFDREDVERMSAALKATEE